MIQNTILNQLNEKGFVVSKIRGISMWPFFNQKNTQVYIKRTPIYKKNDCILFLRSNGQLILHRILKVKDAYFLVSGDNESVVEKVYLEQIKGCVFEYYKHGKTKTLTGFRYHVYLIFMKLCRPLRVLRDFIKKFIKKLIGRK